MYIPHKLWTNLCIGRVSQSALGAVSLLILFKFFWEIILRLKTVYLLRQTV